MKFARSKPPLDEERERLIRNHLADREAWQADTKTEGARRAVRSDPSLISVLLVDDLPMVRRAFRSTFSRHPRFAVIGEADNGSTAIEIAAETEPDAIVLDLAMPELDGLAALARLREVSPRSKIVIFSSFVDMANRMMVEGADAFFEKTAPLAELAVVLEDLCRPRRS